MSTKEKKDSAVIAVLSVTLTLVGTVCMTVAINRWVRVRRKKREEELEKTRLAAFYKLENRRSTAGSMGVNGSEFDKPIGTLLNDVKIDEVYLWEVEHLSKRFKSEAPDLINFMKGTTKKSSDNPPTFLRALSGLDTSVEEFEDDDNNKPTAVETHYNTLIGVNECILADIVRRPGDKSRSKAFIRAGPRRKLHFNPATVNAAIVTCGGLCPGLNNV